MLFECHIKTLGRALAVAMLAMGFNALATNSTQVVAQNNQSKQAISFDELDAQEKTAEKPKKVADEEADVADGTEKPATTRRKLLPSENELVEAKLSALEKKLKEQENALAKAKLALEKEQAVEKSTFDNNAYFSLSITNEAPPLDYRLERTEIFVDGKRIARGGKRNRGLPRVREIFFGPVMPGCHEVIAKAVYVRQKNDLISRFKVNRIEHVSKSQTFIAKNGYRVELAIEGYEAHNTFFNLFRSPALRFNKSVRPNFLPGAPIVSMDDVLKQGRVKINYSTEDSSQSQLLEKSVSIDGLPILVKEKHDVTNNNNIIFDGPLAEGKHTLNVVLLFGEKKWVEGGPSYNFRLKFDRDFYVISGQATLVNLIGMPKDGFRSAAEDSRYARAESRILSIENSEFFPEEGCSLLLAKEAPSKVEEAPKVSPSETVQPPQPTPSTPKEEEPVLQPTKEPSEKSGEEAKEGGV